MTADNLDLLLRRCRLYGEVGRVYMTHLSGRETAQIRTPSKLPQKDAKSLSRLHTAGYLTVSDIHYVAKPRTSKPSLPPWPRPLCSRPQPSFSPWPRPLCSRPQPSFPPWPKSICSRLQPSLSSRHDPRHEPSHASTHGSRDHALRSPRRPAVPHWPWRLPWSSPWRGPSWPLPRGCPPWPLPQGCPSWLTPPWAWDGASYGRGDGSDGHGSRRSQSSQKDEEDEEGKESSQRPQDAETWPPPRQVFKQ